MVPSEFLTLLWGLAPPGQALVWRLPSKQSTWFTKWDNVDKFCLNHMVGQDIYTGVALVSPEFAGTAHNRTSNISAHAIAGLWADIDLAGAAHKKANLPERQESVLDVISEPTIIIHSGHGLQVWWLFEQPWVFSGHSDKLLAHGLTHWWHRELAKTFAQHGWALDATHDLARVMRLPGTVNHKAAPVPVRVIQCCPERRLILKQVLGYLPVELPRIGPQDTRTGVPAPEAVLCPPLQGDHLELRPDAMPPLEKFEALAAVSVKFMQSWLHCRKDMLDQSASAYDLSLASFAVQAEWGDQEIVNLLIAHRRERGEDLKLREDYYQRTIGRARNGYVNI